MIVGDNSSGDGGIKLFRVFYCNRCIVEMLVESDEVVFKEDGSKGWKEVYICPVCKKKYEHLAKDTRGNEDEVVLFKAYYL